MKFTMSKKEEKDINVSYIPNSNITTEPPVTASNENVSYTLLYYTLISMFFNLVLDLKNVQK